MSCVPTSPLAHTLRPTPLSVTYKNKTSHHPDTSAQARKQHDLVRGNHPLAAGLQNQSSALCSVIRDDAGASDLSHTLSFSISTTHLLPRPQSIVLLELALVVRYAVLAEDPAATCQSRSCGYAATTQQRRGLLVWGCGSFATYVPCHCVEWE